MNEHLLKLKGKKILILGFGREGQSTLRFLDKWVKDVTIGIADKNKIESPNKKINIFFGEKYLESIFKYDVVFKSPGIPSKLKEIKEAKKRGIEITSQTKLFFNLCKGKVIGVTGTKGKSTTTTLIYWILKRSGENPIILGNIGKPCLDYLDDSFGKGRYFVFEMSAHQLFDLGQSPHISVFLNIFREHLDYYENFNEYFTAKANIMKFQRKGDYFIYNNNQKLISNLAKKSIAKCLGFNKWGNKFESIIPQNEIPLLGKHNLNNVMAAILVAHSVGISTKKIHRAISSFKPLEHRLQVVDIKNEITFIDDTLATIPEATIAAIKALSGKIGTIILGGEDRGQDFKELAKVILEEKIENIVLFPTTGQKILNDIKEVSKGKRIPKYFFVNNMENAVGECFVNTRKGKICLLSSASPSFGAFKNYEDKSNQFKDRIKAYV